MQQLFLDSDSVPAPTDATSADFPLGIADFTYSDLYRPERLRELAGVFYAEVARADEALHQALMTYLEARGAGLVGTKQESELLIAAAPHLSHFIARLFSIEHERAAHIEQIMAQDPIFQFKTFVVRRALKKFPAEQALTIDSDAAHAALESLRRTAFADTLVADAELGIAQMTTRLLAWEQQLDKRGAKKAETIDDEAIARRTRELERTRQSIAGTDAETLLASFIDESAADGPNLGFVKSALRLLEAWAAAHATQPPARARVRAWVSFHFPHPLNYEHLVQLERPDAELPELMRGLDQNLRRRDGFALTDLRDTPRQVLDEINYCLYCHERDKDSCSKGLREGASNTGAFKRNPLGIALEGCPLDEKISEMHLLQKRGDSIAALALVVIDNPMCPGTGHRICNDCM